MKLNSYTNALKSVEDYLLRRLYAYASKSEYARYFDTREEEWRLTLGELVRALIEYLECNDEPNSGHVGEKIEKYSAAAFGAEEAQRQRQRGVRFDMFLWLVKLVRQAFIDLIYETKLTEELSTTLTTSSFPLWDTPKWPWKRSLKKAVPTEI